MEVISKIIEKAAESSQINLVEKSRRELESIILRVVVQVWHHLRSLPPHPKICSRLFSDLRCKR